MINLYKKPIEFILKHFLKITGTVCLTVSIATGLAAQDISKQNSIPDAPAGAADISPTGMHLEWTHFIGGRLWEYFTERPVSVLDHDGMLYFTGATISPDFPTTPDALQARFNGAQDIFLVKFDTRRPRVVYSTHLGGTRTDPGGTLCVDRTRNNIIIGGNTGSSDFPVTSDALIRQFQGPDFRHADGFLTILGDKGRKLSYSTFIGGPEIDFGIWRVIVEPSGEIVVSGHAGSFEYIPADIIRPNGSGKDGGNYIMKLDKKGQHVLSARLMGDLAIGLDVHRLTSGDYLIVGNTTNPEFPTTDGAFDHTYHGGTPTWGSDGGDLYITRLSADLHTVAFSTLFGGAGDEAKPLIVTVPGGDFFVFGYTNSKDLPVTADAIEKTLEAKDAVFLARFSEDGRQLRYCTYLGGKSGTAERGKGLVYDGRGRIYAAWITTSPDCPVTPGAVQAKHHGGMDVFLLALNITDNSLAYGSYLGGSKDEPRICLAVDDNGAIYAIGNTNSEDFPTETGSTGVRGDQDIFITKFSVPDVKR